MNRHYALLWIALLAIAMGPGYADERLPGLLCTISTGKTQLQRIDLQPQWIWNDQQVLDQRLPASDSVELSIEGWLDVKSGWKLCASRIRCR